MQLTTEPLRIAVPLSDSQETLEYTYTELEDEYSPLNMAFCASPDGVVEQPCGSPYPRCLECDVHTVLVSDTLCNPCSIIAAIEEEITVKRANRICLDCNRPDYIAEDDGGCNCSYSYCDECMSPIKQTGYMGFCDPSCAAAAGYTLLGSYSYTR